MEGGNNQPQDRSDLQNNLDNTSEQLREGGSENEGEQEPPKLAPPPGKDHGLLALSKPDPDPPKAPGD